METGIRVCTFCRQTEISPDGHICGIVSTASVRSTPLEEKLPTMCTIEVVGHEESRKIGKVYDTLGNVTELVPYDHVFGLELRLRSGEIFSVSVDEKIFESVMSEISGPGR